MSVLLLLLTACDGGEAAGGGECVDNGECEQGYACIDETCQPADCLDSSGCSIGYYCNTDTYACESGCGTDDDCYAGEECNVEANECEASDCRNATLDCSVGQLCDTTTGACYDDPAFDHCAQTCDFLSLNTGCGIGSTCYPVIGDTCSLDADCEQGWSCGNFAAYGLGKVCHVDYCYGQCSALDETSCPAGFQCVAIDPSTSICLADCSYYVEQGYL